jgi:predicted dinucleotide-binding enzyme
MARIGFIGLGNMGKPMARCLLRAGHELVVFDTSPESVVSLVMDGAQAAATPSEAVVGVEAVDDVGKIAVLEVDLGGIGGGEGGSHWLRGLVVGCGRC